MIMFRTEAHVGKIYHLVAMENGLRECINDPHLFPRRSTG